MSKKVYAIGLWSFLVAFLLGQVYSYHLYRWATEDIKVEVEYYDMGCHSWAPEGTPPVNVEIIK